MPRYAPFKPFTLTGSATMSKRLQKVSMMYPGRMDLAIQAEAQSVLDESLEKYVPIEEEELARSARTVSSPITVNLNSVNLFAKMASSVEIRFGESGARDYALAVHEHPSTHSPPSWAGISKNQINWSKAGTGVKYLEKPLQIARRTMATRLSVGLRAGLRSIPGAFTSLSP